MSFCVDTVSANRSSSWLSNSFSSLLRFLVLPDPNVLVALGLFVLVEVVEADLIQLESEILPLGSGGVLLFAVRSTTSGFPVGVGVFL